MNPLPIALSLLLAPSPSAKTACPTQIAPLAERLVRDLPSYANRTALRGVSRSQQPELSQVILASPPNLEPLIEPFTIAQSPPDPNLHQVFITTLERQTTRNKNSQFQQHHWLFLVQTNRGWQLSQSFTRTRTYPQSTLITPIRESSQGVIAQAIKVWLRDCNAGSTRP